MLSILFSEHFPNIKLSIKDDTPDGLYKRLIQDEIDFFLLYSKADKFFANVEQLVINQIISFDVAAVISPQAEQHDDITSYHWSFPQVTDRFLDYSTFSKPYKKIKDKGNLAYEMDLNHTRISLAEEGKAATVVPMFLVKDKIAEGKLIQLPVEIEKFELSVFYLKTKPLSQNSKLILDRFKALFDEGI